MNSLLIISTAPALRQDNTFSIDAKFLEGMKFYCAQWDGPVSALLFDRGEKPTFSHQVDEADLPFKVKLESSNYTVGAADLEPYDLALIAGDNHQFLHLGEVGAALKTKVVFMIEYTLETRRQIARLEGANKPVHKRLRSWLWLSQQERRRRKAFQLADGLQANGYPAYADFKALNPDPLLYLDSRIGDDLIATPEEMEARRRRLQSGAPLRILNSGRLERMKGAQDLIPIARRLRSQGIPFEMDIFGTGSLADGIQADIQTEGLSETVRLHAPVNFATELVPFARRNADIFLSCHRQSDPSCTYIESMGCGLPIVGYDNAMLKALCAASKGGWTAPLGEPDKLAAQITALDPETVSAVADRAFDFAKAHQFEAEYARRMTHLKGVLGV